jgi:hypothetical protein
MLFEQDTAALPPFALDTPARGINQQWLGISRQPIGVNAETLHEPLQRQLL